MELLVVGAGRMGRWLGRVCRAKADATLAFADRETTAAERAAETVGGRVAPLAPDADPMEYDAVCLAVPIPVAVEAVQTHAGRGRAVVDVVGVMEPVVRTARETVPNAERLSLHPLFAPENAPGRVAAVVDDRGPTTDRVRNALVAAGNEVFETTPAVHDRAMKTVQAKTHAAVLAFALSAEPVPEEFSTPVFEALTDAVETVTDNDPRVYADVQVAFDGAEDVAVAARRVADAADDADDTAFADLYRRAGNPAETVGPEGSTDRDGDEDEDGKENENDA
jgi:prephenate dehydrogenase